MLPKVPRFRQLDATELRTEDDSQEFRDVNMTRQFVLRETSGGYTATEPETGLIFHPLLIPIYLSGVSALVFFATAAYRSTTAKTLRKHIFRTERSLVPNPNDDITEPDAPAETGLWSGARAHIRANGGSVIFAFRVLRLLGCLGLAGISVAVLILSESLGESGARFDSLGGSGTINWNHSNQNGDWLDGNAWIQLSLCLFYVRISSTTSS